MVCQLADLLAQARAALLAADPVDWTGPASGAYQEVLGDVLAALAVLGHAAGQTETAVARHHAAVAAAPTGPLW